MRKVAEFYKRLPLPFPNFKAPFPEEPMDGYSLTALYQNLEKTNRGRLSFSTKQRMKMNSNDRNFASLESSLLFDYCDVLNRRTDLLRQVEVQKEAGTMI